LAARSKKESGKAKEVVKRDPRKAKPWFDRAETVAETSNYDYALECYLNGLKQDPGNLPKHEALREVAFRRKAKGGKPAGFFEALKGGGSNAIDKMLNAEKLMCKDPLNVRLARDVMRLAVAALNEDEDVDLLDFVEWVGRIVMDLNHKSKKPHKNVYLQARDLFYKAGLLDRAVTACRLAVQLDPKNTTLMHELKDLEAEHYSASSTNEEGTIEKGTFRQNIKDADKQQALAQDAAVSRTERMVEETIQRRRGEYEEDPSDIDRINKFVDALLKKPGEEAEKEAIEVLQSAYAQTSQYRFKVRMGDIQMRAMARRLAAMRKKVLENPDNAELKREFKKAEASRLVFELNEYADRVKNYPTDITLRFEYARRLFYTGKLDEAIATFQQAKSDPKHRSRAHWYLGQCYQKQGWFDEAIETVREGLENHQGDQRGLMDLRYLLMQALCEAAKRNSDVESAREAQRTASTILQEDINYRDIRERMNEIRALVEQLQSQAKTS